MLGVLVCVNFCDGWIYFFLLIWEKFVDLDWWVGGCSLGWVRVELRRWWRWKLWFVGWKGGWFWKEEEILKKW